MHPTKIFSHKIKAAAISTIFVEDFTRCARLMCDVAGACLMNSVRNRDAQ